MRLSVFSSLLIMVTFLVGSVVLLPANSFAKVFGEATVGYESYNEKTDSSDSTKTSFHHNYSLRYEKSGRLGKYGSYGFGLGYEWAAINFTAEDNAGKTDKSITEGHFLYNADYKYNSKTIPLNIALFSRDNNNLALATSLTQINNIGDSVIPNDVTEDFSKSGTKITSGATISFGEINSNSIAAKYPRFAELPKFFFDYRDEYISNLKSSAPEHSRTRWLTTSIAKDSLWLTFKKIQQTDYLTKADTLGSLNAGRGNLDEQSFRIGSVDGSDSRLWVEVTNWIKLSADGLFTKRIEDGNSNNSYSGFDLNLFATATRDKWEARTYNTFSRRTNGDMPLENKLTIPVYISGTWGTDTSWQARFEHKDEQYSYSNLLMESKSTFVSARVETFKRSQFTLSPHASAEMADYSGDKKIALTGGVETSSTRRFSDKLMLNAAYDLTNIREDSSSKANNQLTQVLSGKAIYKISSSLVVTADQRLTVNSGSAISSGAIVSNENFSGGSGILATRSESVTNDYIRSVTSGKLSWTPSARVRINSEASLDFYDVKGNDLDTVMSFSGGIDYSMPQYSINTASRYSKRTVSGYTTDEISMTGAVQYASSSNVNNTVRATYTRTNDFTRLNNYTEIRQQLKYWAPSKTFRGKLVEVVQESTLVESSDTPVYGALYKGVRQISLQGKYFFNSNLYASALSRYSLLSPGNVSEWMGGASLGLQYKLLQGSIDYYQGKRIGGNDNRTERRFSANLKKQF